MIVRSSSSHVVIGASKAGSPVFKHHLARMASSSGVLLPHLGAGMMIAASALERQPSSSLLSAEIVLLWPPAVNNQGPPSIIETKLGVSMRVTSCTPGADAHSQPSQAPPTAALLSLAAQADEEEDGSKATQPPSNNSKGPGLLIHAASNNVGPCLPKSHHDTKLLMVSKDGLLATEPITLAGRGAQTSRYASGLLLCGVDSNLRSMHGWSCF